MAGLDPAIHERKPLDPRGKPGGDGLELDHPEYVPFEYASAMIGGLGRSFRSDAVPQFEKRRIGRNCVEVSDSGHGFADLLYVHDTGRYQHGDAHPELMRSLRESGYRALASLKSAGTIKAIGIGVNEREVLLEAMEWGDWDAFLLAGRYTLLEQAPLDDLLPQCLARGTSIAVGGPLNSGILAGRDTWNYRSAPPEIVERVTAIRAVCDRHGVPLPAAALQFPLAHPAVAAIIPGPRDPGEFRANLELLRHPIPPALWEELKHAKLLHPDAPTPN